MVDVKYSNVFSEVLEILYYLTEPEYKKIPITFIKFLEDNSNPESEFDYNPRQTLDEQNVLPETKVLISIICRDYLVSKEEREKILEKEKKELLEFETAQRKKYNPENIFKNPKGEIQEDSTNHGEIMEYKKSFFSKLIQKIKSFFNKK